MTNSIRYVTVIHINVLKVCFSFLFTENRRAECTGSQSMGRVSFKMGRQQTENCDHVTTWQVHRRKLRTGHRWKPYREAECLRFYFWFCNSRNQRWVTQNVKWQEKLFCWMINWWHTGSDSYRGFYTRLKWFSEKIRYRHFH